MSSFGSIRACADRQQSCDDAARSAGVLRGPPRRWRDEVACRPTPNAAMCTFVAMARRRASKNRPMPASAKSPRRTRELLECPAARRRPSRQAYAGDDLVGLQRGHQRADEERSRRNFPRSGRPTTSIVGIAQNCDAWQFCRGIGMSDAAADRAARADLMMGDMSHGRLSRADAPLTVRRWLRCRTSGPLRRGARHPSTAILSSPGTRRRSTSREGCNSRKASIGIRLWPPEIGRAVPSAGQQRHRFLDAGRADIVEFGKFHGFCALDCERHLFAMVGRRRRHASAIVA